MKFSTGGRWLHVLRDLNAQCDDGYIVYLSTDSSPQGKRDWLNTLATRIPVTEVTALLHNARLSSLFSARPSRPWLLGWHVFRSQARPLVYWGIGVLEACRRISRSPVTCTKQVTFHATAAQAHMLLSWAWPPDCGVSSCSRCCDDVSIWPGPTDLLW